MENSNNSSPLTESHDIKIVMELMIEHIPKLRPKMKPKCLDELRKSNQ